MRSILLSTPAAVLDKIEAKCEGRAGNTDFSKAEIKALLMDHRKLYQLAREAGFDFKES